MVGSYSPVTIFRGSVANRTGNQRARDMSRGQQSIRQLTALLVLTIVTAASGLPHWHAAPPENPDKTDTFLGRSHAGAAFLVATSDADLLECAVCVLQRILTQARTQGTDALPQPSLQAEVVSSFEPRVSGPPLRYADPRGPPSS